MSPVKATYYLLQEMYEREDAGTDVTEVVRACPHARYPRASLQTKNDDGLLGGRVALAAAGIPALPPRVVAGVRPHLDRGRVRVQRSVH